MKKKKTKNKNAVGQSTGHKMLIWKYVSHTESRPSLQCEDFSYRVFILSATGASNMQHSQSAGNLHGQESVNKTDKELRDENVSFFAL